MNIGSRNLPLRDWGQIAMAHLADDLAQAPLLTLNSWVSCTMRCPAMRIGAVFLPLMIIAIPIAKSEQPPTCSSEPRLPTAPGTFGARPGSILSPGHRRSVHSLLSPQRLLPRCPPEAAFELDLPPPPSQLQRAILVPSSPKKTKRSDNPIRKRNDKPAIVQAGKSAGDALRSTARTQRALTAIGIPPDRIDGVLTNKTTYSIRSYQALLGAPTTGRLTKGQRELLWELSAATKR